jgi:hypothetical protein
VVHEARVASVAGRRAEGRGPASRGAQLGGVEGERTRSSEPAVTVRTMRSAAAETFRCSCDIIIPDERTR